MKQVPIGGARTIEENQQVKVLLARFKKAEIPTSIAGQQTQWAQTKLVNCQGIVRMIQDTQERSLLHPQRSQQPRPL